MIWLLHHIDALLIAPFRWPDDPMLGFWLGLIVLLVITLGIGEISRRLAHRLTGKIEGSARRELVKYHELTMSALRSGNGDAYRAVNRLATSSLDRTWGLGMTKTLAMLWPAFLAAAWLHARFDGVVVSEIPLVHVEISALFAFGIAFVALWLLMAHIRARKIDEPEETPS